MNDIAKTATNASKTDPSTSHFPSLPATIAPPRTGYAITMTSFARAVTSCARPRTKCDAIYSSMTSIDYHVSGLPPHPLPSCSTAFGFDRLPSFTRFK